ncbi:MAG: ATP-binding protein [Muribaculaceae bacterium]|nr:ATP-binding protein [Muribaculaceae bacterium]
MRFFDRDKEIEKLRNICELSRQIAQFTVVTGRRRIGKTSLVLKAYKDEPILYFFVSRKVESELCAEYAAEIEEKLGIPQLGTPTRFAEVFEYLMKLAHEQHFTLVIDEFQEFYRVNKAVFSEMQRIWDLHKDNAHINLLVCGSVNSLMNKIFRDKKEPLYNRQTQKISVHPFAPSVLRDIMNEYAPNHCNEDLLALYLFTGGVAKYVELLIDGGCYTAAAMLDAIIQEDSPFIDEGRSMLIEEFGRDYTVYFSILSLIAQGHTTRGDIEDILKKEIGGYLTRLEDDYGLINKTQPMFERSPRKNVHYQIHDNFLRFWFRFVYKYNYMIEISAYGKLKEIVSRDYDTYSGKVLEEFCRLQLVESGQYTRIGMWHDRRGENEIDIIAADELNKKAEFIEVKRKQRNIDLSILRVKADIFLKTTKKLGDYDITYRGLSLDDI